MTFGRGWDRRADDVTTLRRAALAGVGVVAAVIGTLAVAAPAYADDKVGVSVLPPGDFTPGSTGTLIVQVQNKAQGNKQNNIQVSITGLTNFAVTDASGCDVGGASSCVVNVAASDSKQVTFTLKATGNVDPGQSKTDRGRVRAQSIDGSDTADFNATVKGGQPTQAPSVAQVSGTVRDITSGTPIKGAVVVLVDSGACAPGKEACQTGTDNSGGFRFTSRPDKPITPGSIQVGATKSGFDNGVTTVDARAGQSVTVTIKLKPNAEATSSATADPLPTLDTQGPTADAATQAAPGAAQKQASNSGPSAISWIILVLAGLLVLLGVGVFVVLFVNRKKGDAEDDEGDGPPTGPHGSPVPAGGGVYGGAPGANPTMVGGSGMTQTVMAAPGMGDAATTILHPQRPEDEFPDPYNAPYPASPAGYPPNGNGYGGGAYGATQVGGYPAAGQPGGYDPQTQPYGAQPAGYGPGAMRGGEYGGEYAQGAGYGGQGGYDQGAPAGPPPQRYDDATRAWDGPGAGGPPGYGQPAQPGGYDNGYGNGGYANGGGYQQQPPAGYDPHGGYGPPADPYADQAYEHDQRGGYDPYYQQPSETPSRRAPSPGRGRGDQRLDWLDD
jgi:hypothetical protein